MFQRKIYDQIKNWKNNSNGKTALLIEGARCVGKSTIVVAFAKQEYRSYIRIGFSNANQKIIDVFDDMSDLNFFFLSLQLYYDVELHERDSLIIFDDVQYCPKARQAIKVLVKDGRYDYIEIGSFISIKKNVQNILIPSEERKLTMHPMDYEEFLWATGHRSTVEILKTIYLHKPSLGENLHHQLMRQYQTYMFVGGMPQVVSEYIDTHNLRNVDDVKRDIIRLYEDDFLKIDNTERLSYIFQAIPSQLRSKAKGFQTKKVIKSYNVKDETLLSLIAELNESKVVNIAYQCSDPNDDLSTSKNLNQYKIYMADTGLLITLHFKDKDFLENILYAKLLKGTLPSNLGYIYENAVAQLSLQLGMNFSITLGVIRNKKGIIKLISYFLSKTSYARSPLHQQTAEII